MGYVSLRNKGLVLDMEEGSDYDAAYVPADQPHWAAVFHAIACKPDGLSSVPSENTKLPMAMPILALGEIPGLIDRSELSWGEAMSIEHEREMWIQAAIEEITNLEKNGSWIEFPMDQATVRPIPGTWVFKRKVSTVQEKVFIKYKARWALRGDLEPDDGEDTFAPVTHPWTVRLMMLVGLYKEWSFAAIDVKQAFLMAHLPEGKELYAHLPRGFRSNRPYPTCLKMVKSQYGVRSSPKLFGEVRDKAYLEMGFTQSQMDPCLWMKPGIIICHHVDDSLIVYESKERLDELIAGLEQRKFGLTVERELTEFLGISIRHTKDEIRLTQTPLIRKLLKETGMEECNPVHTPAERIPLGRDPDGQKPKTKWNLRSVVGMLLYLATHTRPDIGYSVSQVARVLSDPRESHIRAIKRIVRYLKKTMHEGLILQKPNTLQLLLFTDADLAGLHNVDPIEDKSSARSRMCYMLFLSGGLALSKSTLIPEICLSTSESEISALSHGIRALIPMSRMLNEIAQFIGEVRIERPIAFVDNSSALTLANAHRLTHRTRYFHTKLHWFWEMMEHFDVKKIDTKANPADNGSKGNPREPFERLRKIHNGW